MIILDLFPKKGAQLSLDWRQDACWLPLLPGIKNFQMFAAKYCALAVWGHRGYVYPCLCFLTPFCFCSNLSSNLSFTVFLCPQSLVVRPKQRHCSESWGHQQQHLASDFCHLTSVWPIQHSAVNIFTIFYIFVRLKIVRLFIYLMFVYCYFIVLFLVYVNRRSAWKLARPLRHHSSRLLHLFLRQSHNSLYIILLFLPQKEISNQIPNWILEAKTCSNMVLFPFVSFIQIMASCEKVMYRMAGIRRVQIQNQTWKPYKHVLWVLISIA